MAVALRRCGAILRVGASILVATAVAACAGEMPSRVSVLVNNYAVPARTLRLAEMAAANVFRRARIEVTWADCDFSAEHPAKCRALEEIKDPLDLFVNLLPRAMADALAMPPDRLGGVVQHRAFILYHRVEQAAEETASARIPISMVLGYVMAHELGHMILGDDRHASEGVMRPAFRASDCLLTRKAKCLFTEEQAERMRAQLNAPRPR